MHEPLGHAAQSAPLEGIKILVVDDEEDIRTFLLAVFADAGAIVAEAADGFEAVAMAAEMQPDLITLDLSMPGQDGIASFCKLRSMATTESIPICIVTGHPEYRSLIYDRPARPPEGFIYKPVAPEHLLRTVLRILGLRRRRRQREAAAQPSSHQ